MQPYLLVTKRLIVALLAVVLVAASLGVSPVAAQSTACGSTYTVQRGDYLAKIARSCGITLTALINANPTISNWNIIYPGQVLNIPSGTTPAPVTGGSIYVVKPGDTLNKIAARFGVTLDSILKANPSITNANRIEVGQQIRLPEGAAQVPTVSIAPVTGNAGATITLGVTGFSANVNVDILFGQSESQLESIGRVTTDANGAVLQQVTVPANAQAGKAYIFVVRSAQNANERATSNTFTVGGGTSGGTAQTYVVQSGDILRTIAARFKTSVAAILIANPAVTNPNLIYVGQRLTIPAPQSGALVAVAPTGGTPGSTIYVVAGGFPANQNVDVDLGLEGGTLSVVLDAKTDSSGYISKTVTIPSSARAGERWVARVRTTDLAQGVSAISNAFTVR
ncbi:MAG TPA: LysM peptidoglycan-binding domain-containing protein [Anaerolineaceae bacterium]|nr:LysM peptidoglycan-binding domain-containing protein [Anaerolineaceae bacterium]